MTRGSTRQFRCCLYSRCGGLRLWRAGAAVGLLAMALASGGCSMSYQLNSYNLSSIFGGSGSKAKANTGADTSDITGSIGRRPATKTAAKLPPTDDLAYAKAAVSKLLALGRKYASLPWENPATGARGTITPITSRLCRRRWPDLPRFPGELHQGQSAVLAAGRGLQAPHGAVDGALDEALEELLSVSRRSGNRFAVRKRDKRQDSSLRNGPELNKRARNPTLRPEHSEVSGLKPGAGASPPITEIEAYARPLRRSGGAEERERGGDQERLSQARQEASPGRQ